MDTGYEMLFERTVRSFLDDKAYNIAGQAHNERARREWYRKILKMVSKRIDLIDANATHKERIEFWCGRLLDLTSQKRLDEQSFLLYLLLLVRALLGYPGFAAPAYFRPPGEPPKTFDDAETSQETYDKKSVTGIRRRLIAQLRAENLNDFQIALVLNTTEYRVKRLRSEL